MFETFVQTQIIFCEKSTLLNTTLKAAYVAYNENKTTGILKLYKHLGELAGVTKNKTSFTGIKLKAVKVKVVPTVEPIVAQPTNDLLAQIIALVGKPNEEQLAIERERLELERVKIAQQKELKLKKIAQDERIEHTRVETKKDIVKTQIESTERMFVQKLEFEEKRMNATRSMHNERITHEKEENNKNRWLMCHGEDSHYYDGKMLNAYGNGSNVYITRDSLAHMIDSKIDRKSVPRVAKIINLATHQITSASNKQVNVIDSRMIEPVLNMIQGESFSPCDELIKSTRVHVSVDDLDTYDEYFTTKDNTFEFIEEPIKEINNDSTTDEETDESSSEESDSFDFTKQTNIDLINEINKSLTIVERCMAELAVRDTVLEVSKNPEIISATTKQCKSLKKLIKKITQDLKFYNESMITRGSVQGPTEIKRDSLELKQKRKTMVKDIVDLMKPQNEYNARTQMFKCYICKCSLHVDDMFVDRCHVVSSVDGGDCSIENIVPGCMKCNRTSGRVNADDVELILCKN